MDDKKNTKQRLIETACVEFAQMGYSKARIREISSQAKANLAAVNYHFGSKSKLYLAVFEYLYQETEMRYELEETDFSSREACLHTLKRITEKFFDSLDGSDMMIMKNRILYREIIEPSEMHSEIFSIFLKPRFDYIERIVRGICGDELSSDEVKTKLLALIAQFSFYSNSYRLIPAMMGDADFMKRNKNIIMHNMLILFEDVIS